MKRLVFAALLLTPLSLYAVMPRDSNWSLAPDAASCPADTAATGGPSYAWNGSRFVFEGYICESKNRGTTVGN
jgi:hypothetical protein